MKRFIFSIITMLLFAVNIGPVMADYIGVSAGAGILGMIGVSVLGSFVTMPSGVLTMAVQKEIWVKDIVEKLFKDNSFLKFAFDADSYVVNGKVVHIPQSGSGGDVVKNRSSLPATVKKRSDTDVTYAIDEYTSDPMLIPNADKVELSYNKRESVLAEEQGNLNESVAEEMLYTWAEDLPEGSMVDTTGDAVPATVPGATGNRKALVRADLQKASVLMNKQNIPKNNRYALLSAELEAQLFPPDSQVTALYMQSVTKEEQDMGVIGKVHGFKILSRSFVLTLTSDNTVKAPEASTATDDNEGVLCWQKNAVERAMGTNEFFEDTKNPQYYGDIYSFLVRMGGRRRREDNKGVVIIKQAPAS